MAEISASHSGTSADNKGVLKFFVNDGNDGSGALQTVMSLGPKVEYTSGTASGAGDESNTIVLENKEDTSSENDFYNTYYIQITGGSGSGQIQRISDYVGNTRTVTVENDWDTAVDNTSVYYIYEASVTIFGDLNVNSTVKSTNTTISIH